MTAAKDMSRPSSSQHRLSVGSHASSLPHRNSYSRSHSHTLSVGTTGPPNRIGRRKSSTFGSVANVAALGAAVETAVADGAVVIDRRSSISRHALGVLNDGGPSAFPASLPHQLTAPERMHASRNGSALIDGPPLSASDDKMRLSVRRASDGIRLIKKDKTAPSELKCETCGKSYKHGSCLTKHLWEHTPQWQVTSKLLISKHQQVQLLEAASVLVAMNQDGTNDSDSSSPAASGSSDLRDEDISSAETTPPPQHDSSDRETKRFSNTSSAFSRSYQSVFSESAPHHEHGFAHHRQWSTSSQNRPTTANTSIAESYVDEDPQDLAAAIGLLSCSYGTPKSGPIHLASHVPPVPPLPAKYASYVQHTVRDIDMDDDDTSDDDDRHHHHSHLSRMDEAEEGMFGNMD